MGGREVGYSFLVYFSCRILARLRFASVSLWLEDVATVLHGINIALCSVYSTIYTLWLLYIHHCNCNTDNLKLC